MDNSYLEEYKSIYSKDLYRGPGGWFRRLLDDRAVRLGQADRHALFLKRALDLVGLDEAEMRTVLDIGTGNGGSISYVSPAVARYAIDRGDLYKEALEAQGIHFTVLDVEANRLPYEDNTFDLTILSHVIEHIANYDHVVSELRRVTKPGRFVYLRTPDIQRVKQAFYDDYTHVKPYTAYALKHLMMAHGMEEVFLFHSDHPRINVDILTSGRWRKMLFGSLLGGAELEAAYVKR